jgi:hypothetical protein
MSTLGKIMFLFVITASLSAENTALDQKWIENRFIQRQLHIDKNNKNDIRIYDESTLNSISESTIASGEEKFAEYLFKVIILDKKLNHTANAVLALDLLITRISDPKYFLKYSQDIARFEIAANPFIIKKLLAGYTRFLEKNPDLVIKSFEFTYLNLKFYLYNRGEYGADYIIPDYYVFLSAYMQLIADKKIEDTWRKQFISYGEELGLSRKGPSDYSRYKGFEQLKQDFFYYNNQKVNR